MKNFLEAVKAIIEGKTYLGIEFGSTRIKSILIDSNYNTLATGSHVWENKFEDGYWTYTEADIIEGMRNSYGSLVAEVQKKYSVELTNIACIGISAMMHGYMAFDIGDNLLVPFRTWRNITTTKAAEILSKELSFNIPERWSIAHIYQAIINRESHVKNIAWVNTLAGYIHYKLTGLKVLGIGDASGMFPVKENEYNREMIIKTEKLFSLNGCGLRLSEIFPSILNAGENAGYLTEQGAKLLDSTGKLKSGIPFCPPEGDAGTGMVATNSVRKETGNVSAGTSIFAMVVLKQILSKYYSEIDIVSTPDGSPVAMVHCNNCSGDIDAWMSIFMEAVKESGFEIEKSRLYDVLLTKSEEADKEIGGLMNFNYLSGESITKIPQGVPIFLRQTGGHFNLANFMKTQLYSALATLIIGMEHLYAENVKIDKMTVHGGFFIARVGAEAMAAALKTPVNLFKTAGEGGPWGMAVLAAYSRNRVYNNLPDFLQNEVFRDFDSITINPTDESIESFSAFLQKYRKYLCIEIETARCMYD